MNFIKSPLEMLYELSGMPHMADGKSVPKYTYTSGALGLGAHQIAPENVIEAYRADPKGKYGGKEGIETQPTHFDKKEFFDNIRAMRVGRFYGVPQLTPEQLAALALVEGRSDFGANRGFHNVNDKTFPTMEQIRSHIYGEDSDPKMWPHRPVLFAGIVKDKMEMANRLKQPFARVWNGLGVGPTKNYPGRFDAAMKIVSHPKNAALMQAINEAYNYQPPEPLQLGGLQHANPAGDYSPPGQ